MANVVTTEVLEDGQRNYVVKIVGVIDTSDVAATGTIGTGGFTTTIGSNSVTFTAGTLVPTQGQYLTFSDGTTTFNAGTYVISVVSATNILVSNVAKANNAAAAVTITGTAGGIVVADPAQMSFVRNYWEKPAQIILDRVTYMVETGIDARLYWEATANVPIIICVGSGHTPDYRRFGGLTNNAGTGKTGRIVLTTQGWATGAINEFTLTLECLKQAAN